MAAVLHKSAATGHLATQPSMHANLASQPANCASLAFQPSVRTRKAFSTASRLDATSIPSHRRWTPSIRMEATKASAAGAGASETVERSYVMIKPDGVQRGLVGEIITRFERKGFVLKGLKLFQTPQELAEEHYKDLKSKPFYPKLVEYIISGPVVAMAWEGQGVVASARKLIGATNPLAAEPGTIRGDFAVDVGRNVVHGSDSVENGTREIALWFKDGELCDWEPVSTPWLWE